MSMPREVSMQDRRLLRAAALPHKDAGDELYALLSQGMSLTRAWQRVNILIDTPEAWELDPDALLVLKRRREARSRFTRAARP